MQTRRTMWEELLIVLSLSVLASAVYAILDLLSAPLAGVTRSLYPNVELGKQVASIVFGLAPVALVAHLARRDGEGLASFGLASSTLRSDLGWGSLGAVAVAMGGVSLYLAAVSLGVNRFIVPVPPLGHWWTVPILLAGSFQAALLEEVIVVGYLIRRLEQLGWMAIGAVAASAVLRGAYHLYQGWGGFVGNLVLGFAFGWAFVKWRRTWPLIVAHFLVDALAGLGYLAFHGKCFFGACLA